MAITVQDIAKAIEHWAPLQTAQSYDNVGLQIGRMNKAVERVLVALDATPEVVREALEEHIDLVVTHHPLLFQPLRVLTSNSFVGSLALRFAESSVALYAAHTNLDAAEGGVSFALAEQLGLVDVEFLAPLGGHMRKLVAFVPATHAAAVRAAVAEAGAGVIGKYDSCAFTSTGTGHFRASADANPFVGAKGGDVNSVDEVRLEVAVPDWRLPAVTSALRSAHPYEEVAYDTYEVKEPYLSAGLGAIGRLSEPVSLEDFLRGVAEALSVPALRYAGQAGRPIARVAVCGGSGSDLLGVAIGQGAEAFVTADVTYHRYFDIFDPTGASNILLVDAGHYETERIAQQLLVDFLARSFPGLTVKSTRHRTGPMRHFTSG